MRFYFQWEKLVWLSGFSRKLFRDFKPPRSTRMFLYRNRIIVYIRTRATIFIINRAGFRYCYYNNNQNIVLGGGRWRPILGNVQVRTGRTATLTPSTLERYRTLPRTRVCSRANRPSPVFFRRDSSVVFCVCFFFVHSVSTTSRSKISLPSWFAGLPIRPCFLRPSRGTGQVVRIVIGYIILLCYYCNYCFCSFNRLKIAFVILHFVLILLLFSRRHR